MAKAKYTVQVPKADTLGNSLRVGQAAHQFLVTGPLRLDLVTLSAGHPHDALHVHADDTPEHDSHVKQLAAFLGEVSNVEGITAAKEGKSGIQTWTVPNRGFVPGQAAEVSAQATGSKSIDHSPSTRF